MFSKRCLAAILSLLISVATALAAPADGTIELRPDRVYELAAVWVAPEKRADLDRYFSQAFPIAVKYGLKPVVSFTSGTAHSGDFTPDMFFLSEWPSLEAFQSFIEDPAEKKLIPMRDGAAEKLVVTHVRVAEPTSFSLREGELVELAALWVRPGKEEQLGSYFQKALPIAIRHGARPLASFHPVHVYRGDLKPTSLSLAVWSSPEAFRATFADPELKPLLPSRDAALEKALVTHFRAHFETGSH